MKLLSNIFAIIFITLAVTTTALKSIPTKCIVGYAITHWAVRKETVNKLLNNFEIVLNSFKLLSLY